MARWTILAAIVCLLVAPVARADGDPASDYLLSQSAFVPPDTNVPNGDATQLRTVLADAKARGYEIRVALIATHVRHGLRRIALPQAAAVRSVPRPGALLRLQGTVARRDAERLRSLARRQALAACDAASHRPPSATRAPAAARSRPAQPLRSASSQPRVASRLRCRRLRPQRGVRPASRLLIGIVALVILAGAGAAVLVRRRRA